MFYTIVKSLILPPGSLILLLLLGFLLVRGVLGRVVLFIAISVLTLMSIPTVSGWLAAGLEPYPALPLEALAHTDADAILVLGGERYSWAPEYGGDTVGAWTLARLRYGAFLHRHTDLPVYITGGSPAPEYPPLGRLMAKVLEQDYGISAAGIEDRSQTTAENAAFSVEMLKRDGIQRVLLVTHASHLPRAVGAFERAGIAVTPAPTCFFHREDGHSLSFRDWLPSAGAFLVSYFAIHEYLGQVWYQLQSDVDKAPSAVG